MIKERLKLLKDNITNLSVDAIVNAANTSLLGGGGVDGAIHKAAGPKLLEECKTLGGCSPGQAKITKGYNLQAKFVVHTVGPIWRGGCKGEPRLLASCYFSSMKLAQAYNIKRIAFPAISCGIYGYPISQAATIAVKEVANYLELHSEIEEVILVCFDDAVFAAYQQAFDLLTHE